MSRVVGPLYLGLWLYGQSALQSTLYQIGTDFKSGQMSIDTPKELLANTIVSLLAEFMDFLAQSKSQLNEIEKVRHSGS